MNQMNWEAPLSLILTVFLLFFLQLLHTPAAEGQAVVSIGLPSIQSPAVGAEFTVNVNIAGGVNVAGYQITVTFDPTALEFVNIENADYLPAGAFATPPNVAADRVTLAAAGGAANGDGTLAKVTFKVVEVKASTMGLVEVALSDPGATALAVTTQDRPIFQPPTITSVAPASGPVAGGTGITITGANFVAGATVTIGGNEATNVTVVSATELTATTPEASSVGAASVVATSPDGQSVTLENGFTYTVSPGDVPVIVRLTESQTLPQGSSSLTLEAEVLGSGIFRVFATVVPPGGPDGPPPFQEEFDEFEMERGNGDIYTGTYRDFTRLGEYRVWVSAENAAGSATAKSTRITVPTPTPPPFVAAVSPASGLVTGGTSIRIIGTNFQDGATVTIGGQEATNVVVVTATEITVTTPSAVSAGAADVTVTNPDGRSDTSTGGFTYSESLPLPVTSSSPNSGPTAGGTTVTITGENFRQGATVTIGGNEATDVTFVSSTELTATTPAGAAGAADVTVTNPDGQSGTLSEGFTYIPPPRVTAISPDSGSTTGGTDVTITGLAFQEGATVTIGGQDATNVVVVSATEISATTPAGAAGVASVTVTNPDGQLATLEYTYVEPEAPTANFSANPRLGAVPLTVQFTDASTAGTNPIANRSWDFDNDGVVDSTDQNPTHTYDLVGTYTVKLTVSDDGNLTDDETKVGHIRVDREPTVTAVSPSSGTTAGGTQLTLTGEDFRQGATVTIGGGEATNITFVSSTELTATTPAAEAGNVDVIVTNPFGVSGTLPGGFTYVPPLTVTQITPNRGPTSGGTEVTVNGESFRDGATVTIGGRGAGNVTFGSSTELTATTPPGSPGVALVVVTNPDPDGQTGSLTGGFTYDPPPTVRTILPNRGPTIGGTEVTINGENFQDGATVTIGGTPATEVTFVSSTGLKATTPAVDANPVDVAVTNPDQQSDTLPGGYTGTLSITVNLPLIDFSTVPVGSSAEVPITIGNVGGVALEITGITTELGGVLQISETTFILAPDQERQVVLTLTPSGTTPISGTLSIGSSDPSTPTEIPIFANAPPRVEAQGLEVREGNSFTFRTGFENDVFTDTHTATIDWGDGTEPEAARVDETGGSGTVTGSHTYVDDGGFTATITVTDDDGERGEGTVSITVENQEPVVDADDNQMSSEGDAVTINASFTDPGILDTHTAEIDWGDGTTETVEANSSNGSGTVIGEHRYIDDGIFTIQIRVADNGGAIGEKSVTVTVADLPPVVETVEADVTEPNEGEPVTINIKFTDPGTDDTHTARILWGDGEEGSGRLVETAGSGTVIATHAYADNREFTVDITIMDSEEGKEVASRPFTFNVQNLPPVFTAVPDQTADEGNTVILTTGFIDPGTGDTHTAEIDWGDGTVEPGEVNETNGVGTVTGRHKYGDNGTFTVNVAVTDDDGGTQENPVTMTVTNIDPIVTVVEDGKAVVGEPFTIRAISIDAGTLDTHTAEIDWGDGTVEPGGVSASGGSVTVIGSHEYRAIGDFTATVTVTDDDGGSGSDTLAVTVTPLPDPPSISVQRIEVEKVDQKASEFIGINQRFDVKVTLENQGGSSAILAPSEGDLSVGAPEYEVLAVSPSTPQLGAGQSATVIYRVQTLDTTPDGTQDISVVNLAITDVRTQEQVELGEKSASQTITIEKKRPALESAFLVDTDVNGQVNAGDTLTLTFELPIRVGASANGRDFLLLPSGELLQAPLPINSGDTQVVITFEEPSAQLTTEGIEGIHGETAVALGLRIAEASSIVSQSAGNSPETNVVDIGVDENNPPTIVNMSLANETVNTEPEIHLLLSDTQGGLASGFSLDPTLHEYRLDGSEADVIVAVNPFVGNDDSAAPATHKSIELIVTFRQSLGVGRHTFTVTAKDLAGNASAPGNVTFTASADLIIDLATYPNPFAPRKGESATIRYILSQPQAVTINIYDVSGRLVRTFNQNGVKGLNDTLKWNGTTDGAEELVGNGVYICQLVADNDRKYWKIVVGASVKRK